MAPLLQYHLFIAFLTLLCTTRSYSRSTSEKDLSFCETKTSTTQTSKECKDVVTLIQEDINNADALLIVVTRNPWDGFPEPRLVRLYDNGSQDVVAGERGARFLSMSSFLQVNQTTILITDPDMRCIRYADIHTKDVNTFSGHCSRHWNAQNSSGIEVIDGSIKKSTYRGPYFLLQHPLSNRAVVIVSDLDRIRAIELVNDEVSTLIRVTDSGFSGTSGLRFYEIIRNNNDRHYILSTSLGIITMTQTWYTGYKIIGRTNRQSPQGAWFEARKAARFHIEILPSRKSTMFMFSGKDLLNVELIDYKMSVLYLDQVYHKSTDYPHAFKVSSDRLYYVKNWEYSCDVCMQVKYKEISGLCAEHGDSQTQSLPDTLLRGNGECPEALYDSLFKSVGLTEIWYNVEATDSPQTTTTALLQASEKHPLNLVISLSVTLPTTLCVFSLLSVSIWVMRRRQSQRPHVNFKSSSKKRYNVNFYKRTLPEVPVCSSNIDSEYCVISEGLPRVDLVPELFVYESSNQETIAQNLNVAHEDVTSASSTMPHHIGTYVVGDIECVDQ